MKVTVNLRDYILDAADGDHMLTATTSFSVDELFDGNAIEEEHEIDVDLDELLAENRQIAHVWATDDVQALRPDLDEDQAWQVLRTARDRLDASLGVTWDVLETLAEELFGPKPERRWRGRIDVTITDTDGYGQGEVIDRLRDMATLLAKDMPDVQAHAEEGSVRLLGADETTSA